MRKASQKEVTLSWASEDQLNREKGKTLKTGNGNFNKNAESGKSKAYLGSKFG